jgi:predicted transcriptional regulator
VYYCAYNMAWKTICQVGFTVSVACDTCYMRFCISPIHILCYPCYDTDMTDLTAAGLTKTEAACYEALLERAEWKPADLAKYVNETRTNCYKILDKLVSLGLASRFDKDKKLHYRAASPARLIELAHKARAEREQAEKELELGAQALMTTYFKSQEQAGIQQFQGEAEIRLIFEDISKSKTDVLFINSLAGIDFYGFEAMHNLRMLAPLAGVKRRALTPDGNLATADYNLKDPLVLLERTWLSHKDYSAPVEWGVFDNKVYIISYGSEATGIVIESDQIASAFRQLFNIMEHGQRALPGYDKLPVQASKLAAPPEKL